MFLGAAAGLAGREARACSPWDPSLDRTFPPAGEALPHGAALLLDGHVLMPDELAVTVDGQPAELVLLPEHSVAFHHFGWGFAYRTMALHIKPVPEPGQMVVLTGDPCLQVEEQTYCEEIELSYPVGEADPDAPDAPAELWYDVYDHESEASTHSSCGSSSARFELTVHAEIERQVLEFPLEYQLSRRPRAEPDAWSLIEHDWLFDAEAHDPSIRWQHVLAAVEELLPLAEAYCLRLQTFDASENLGGELEVCPPCRDQVGPGDEGGFIAWPEGYPAYDDDSFYPEGHCPAALQPGEDSGSSGDSGGDEGTEPATTGTSGTSMDAASGSSGDALPSADSAGSGCACTAASAGRTEGAVGGLLGLLLLGLRRRLTTTPSTARPRSSRAPRGRPCAAGRRWRGRTRRAAAAPPRCR